MSPVGVSELASTNSRVTYQKQTASGDEAVDIVPARDKQLWEDAPELANALPSMVGPSVPSVNPPIGAAAPALLGADATRVAGIYS